jgi:PAS domain S-box-containing protein
MSELSAYREHVRARLRALSPFLRDYALGDFSAQIEVPEAEDEFTELLVGLSLMIDDFREMVQELQGAQKDLLLKNSELEEQARLIAAIANTTPALIYVYDMEAQSNVYSNPGVERLLGYTPQDIQAMGADLFPRLIHPDDLSEVIAFQSQILAASDQEILEIAYRIKHRDGEWRTWHSFESPFLRNPDGSVKQKVGISIDVTERRRAEEELLLKDMVFESSIAANIIVDNDGLVTHANPAALAMWGYEMEETATGQAFTAFFVHPGEAAPIIAALDETGRWEGEFLAKRRDGTAFITRGLATVVRDESGGQIGYQSANLDVTVQREAEEELAERLEELERFNRLAVGREKRMIALKRQVNELAEQLGEAPPYDVSFAAGSRGST